jgi:hypothetical protein
LNSSEYCFINFPYTIAPLKFKQNPLPGDDIYPDTGG